MRPRIAWAVSAASLLLACYPSAYSAGAHSQVAARPTASFPVAWNSATTPPATTVSTTVVAEQHQSSPAPVALTNNGIVAVMPSDAREAHLDAPTLFAFDEAIRTVTGEVLTPVGYTVLTSETTLTVLHDNGIDATKACEASCALEAARELKAKLFVSASIAKTEGQFVAFVRLFENAQGKQLGAVELDGSTVRELRESFSKKAPELFARVLKQ